MPASDSHNPPDARDVVWQLEAEVERLREALTLVQKLVNIPSEQILDDTERARRIKLVVDTSLAAREALEAGER